MPASAKLTISLPTTASSRTVISVAPPYPAGTPSGQTGWTDRGAVPREYGPALSDSSGKSNEPAAMELQRLPVGYHKPERWAAFDRCNAFYFEPAASLVVNSGLTTANFTAALGTSPDTLSFAYTTGTPWNATLSELDVSNNGGIIPFNVMAANAPGSGSSGSTTTPGVASCSSGPSVGQRTAQFPNEWRSRGRFQRPNFGVFRLDLGGIATSRQLWRHGDVDRQQCGKSKPSGCRESGGFHRSSRRIFHLPHIPGAHCQPHDQH